MTALILSFLSSPTVLAIIGGIAALFGWGWHRERVGRSKERAKQAERDALAKDERLEMHREATEAERQAAGMTDEEAREEALSWRKRR